MRKLLICGIVCSNIFASYSFYKFQKPYIVPGKHVNNHQGDIDTALPIQIPNDLLNHKAKPYDIPILYEPITSSYLLTSPLAYNSYPQNNTLIVEQRSDNKDPIYDFLKCNFHYDPGHFWKLNNLKNYESFTSGRNWGPLLFFKINNQNKSTYIYLIGIGLAIHNLIHKDRLTYLQTFYSSSTAKKEPISHNGNEKINALSLEHIGENSEMCTPIRLQRKITVANGTMEVINQEDGVKLYKKDKNGIIFPGIDLKTALLNYYNSTYIQAEFIQRLIEDIKENPSSPSLKNSTALWGATQCYHPTLKQPDYDLLVHSDILAVWYVQANQFDPPRYFYQEERDQSYYFKRPIYSVLVGLARHKTTKEIFHWVTDLGRDIEVLFPIHSLQKSKMVDVSVQTNPEALPEEVRHIDKKRKHQEVIEPSSNYKKYKTEEASSVYDANTQID